MQRQYHVGILVAHHSRKAGAESQQAGLNLRGSGDFHAWGQSNLYLRRRRGALELVIERKRPLNPIWRPSDSRRYFVAKEVSHEEI